LEFDENIVNVDISMKRKNDQTVVNVRGELLENIEDELYVRTFLFKYLKSVFFVFY